jgi:hypothetical protein
MKPPLSIPILTQVSAVEHYAQRLLQDCGDFTSFTRDKIIRGFRTYAVELFDIEADYYFRLDDPDSEWINEIRDEIIRSLTSLFRPDQNDACEEVRRELYFTFQEHLKRWKPKSNALTGRTQSAVVKEADKPEGRAAIDAFIEEVFQETGRKIPRNAIYGRLRDTRTLLNSSGFREMMNAVRRPRKTTSVVCYE